MTDPERLDPPDTQKSGPPAKPPDPDPSSSASPLASNRLVVVADDDEGLRWVVSNWLETHGLTTLGVGSGGDAVAAVQQHPDCLLLLDYYLSDMDGHQVLDKLNALGIVVPFVVMTGNGDERVAVEMMKLGARDYIVKRVDFTDLLVPVVERVLAQLATEERLATSENALRESEMRLHAVFDNSRDAISLSRDGLHVLVNPAYVRMFGLPDAEGLIGTPTNVRIAPSHRDQVQGYTDLRSRGEPAPSEYDTRCIRQDGTEFDAEVSVSQYRLGTETYSLALLRDITERKRAEEKLRSAFAEIQVLKDQLEAENVYLREEMKLSHVHGDIVGESPAIKKTLALAEQVAPTDSTVLICGETGTGKELLARSIHSLSPRKDRPLVTVNCAAMPSTLIESELFGREKGAYTGALTRQAGRFEVADKSTLFLDEVGELSPEAQAKLLRVLQEGKFERLGSSNTMTVDVRVIAATNRDIEQAVKDGRFREDLFYRLNVFPITIPPLRERREDIPMLVWTFVHEFGEKMGKRIESIPKKILDALSGHPWPGNVRALRNTIERAMILSTGTTLHVELPGVRPGDAVPTSLDDAQRSHVTQILESTNWRIRGKGGAAEQVGLKPTTLEYRIKKLGIRRQPEDKS
jgi:PAS domain S-box-containing protein